MVFLIDKDPASKIILLRRSPEKSFAPNFYTGIGGKIGDLPGLENESVLDSAYRELAEETEGELNKENIKLEEFARCIYDSGLTIYYFWGKYVLNDLPHINSKDGTLSWVDVKQLLEKDIIPTTKAVCKEWSKRGFAISTPFTIYVREIGQEQTVRLVETLKVLDGLQE